jgi:DNA-binding winged helix-turn-helix (wHTH) protein
MTGDLARRPERFYAFGPFRLMPERQLLMRGETPIRIGSRALDILQVLLDCAGEVVGKRERLSRVWPDMSVEEGNLKTNIAVLRRALGDETGKATYIATVTGRGYRFIARVQASEAISPASAAWGGNRERASWISPAASMISI